jgi:hypothetical protein
MSTNYNSEPATYTIPPASAAKPKSIGKRAALAATLLVSSGLALAGLGLASGTAQADPGPAPLHYQTHHDDDWYPWWCFDWDWDHCHYDFDHRDHDHHDHDHDH